MKIDNTPVRGSRDLLPDSVAARDRVFAGIAGTYAVFGYRRIETPALESIERLTDGQGGDNEKLIYQVLRRGLGDRIEAPAAVRDLVDLGLRFDLTVSLGRFYGQHHASLPLPFRAFQFGPVWRAERPQRGRYRQFHQCDIDIIGEPEVLAEVELIEATTAALRAVGLGDTVVRLSDRRVLAALAASAGVPDDATTPFFVTLDKLDKIGWPGVRSELLQRGLAPASVDRVADTVDGLAGIEPAKVASLLADHLPGLGATVLSDLDQTLHAVNALSVAVSFDPTLVRGMGYYTGQVFEIGHPDMPGSVAGGGRYDGLVGRSLGREVPACGFSIGFERIVDLLGVAHDSTTVVLLCESAVTATAALAAARVLRADDRPVAVVRRQGKLGAQLTRLRAWGYPAFVHVRDDAEAADVAGQTPRVLTDRDRD